MVKVVVHRPAFGLFQNDDGRQGNKAYMPVHVTRSSGEQSAEMSGHEEAPLVLAKKTLLLCMQVQTQYLWMLDVGCHMC